MKHFYEPCRENNEIGQGDIFSCLPFAQISSTEIMEMVPEGDKSVAKEIDLLQYVGTEGSPKNVIAKVTIQPGIVITQNCDLLRSETISFCAIKKYTEIEKQNTSLKTPKQVEFLTKNYRNTAKYFYLPSIQGETDFDERMAVDFSCIYQLSTKVVKQLLPKRKSRLGDIPLSHFRVKLGHYFERFAYDPWYVLNKQEFDIYFNSLEDNEKNITLKFDWQK